MLRRILLLIALLTASLTFLRAAPDPLLDGFRAPPASARPQTWWHWVNGNISREGITADLEAMQRIGVGGAQIFNVSPAVGGAEEGPVTILSPEWLALVKHSIVEADRLGLEIAVLNCPGWTESGGPWVKPAQSMQQVVWGEQHVSGPAKVSLPLPQPLSVEGYYADIAVLAFPADATGDIDPGVTKPKLTGSSGAECGFLLRTGQSVALELPRPSREKPQYVQVEFAQPQSLGSVRLLGRDASSVPTTGSVEASDDGVTFREVAPFPQVARAKRPAYLATFPTTRARFFRFVFTGMPKGDAPVGLTGIELGGPRIPRSEEKAAFSNNVERQFSTGEVVSAAITTPVIDLTTHVRDGKLEWDAPAGNWTILRFGHTSTGRSVGPAPASGQGLEVDKMSRSAVEMHFNAMIGRIIEQVGPLAGRSFKYVLADSWEVGCQNWTPRMREEFKRLRGYDLLPYLPALTGRVVTNQETTERFLWDYRRTVAELIAKNHYGTIRELCHRHGMLFTAEAPGINMPTVADELECKGQTDVPMGEFWMDGHNDTKEAAASAHIYGTNIAAAEAFTAQPKDAQWMKAPFDHKALGDLHFTNGINRFVFHRYAHQPWLDRLPGMTVGRWGTNFERTNTWWEQARAWMAYVTRCQFLLQQGRFVGDVAYFYGEKVPNTLNGRAPAIPAGHDYDAVNADVLLNRFSVRDGRLVLPEGTSYRALLLSDFDRMSLPVARKLRDLIAAGATVIGRRPQHTPSLTAFPSSEEEFQRITAEVWGDCDGVKVKEHAFGKGRIICGRDLAEVLTEVTRGPDFSFEAPAGKFAFIHRRAGDADLYFVSNQAKEAVHARLTFRIGDRTPELWHPDTGLSETPAAFVQKDGRTTLPIAFDPAGSVFVVFRQRRAVDPVVGITRNGEAAPRLLSELRVSEAGGVDLAVTEAGRYEATTAGGKVLRAEVTNVLPTVPVAGPWELRFPANWAAPLEVNVDALISWTKFAQDAAKYFSGTATYVKEIELTPDAMTAGRRVWLDLGRVKEIAEVKVNGRDVGVLWKPPFRADITDGVRPGKNRLEVRITNLWPNRLVGDAHLPSAERRTWTTYNQFTAESPLLESGLLGPVALQIVQHVPLAP